MDDSSSEDNDALSAYDSDRDSADWIFQGHRPGSSDASPSDEGGARAAAKMAGNDTDSLLAFIDEARLEEAREFRRKGYNRQVPEVDPELLTQLRKAVAATKSRTLTRATVRGPLGSLWMMEQTDKIERFTARLSEDSMRDWVRDTLPGKSTGETPEASPGSRKAAQSLVRRLESTLQTLIRVVDILCLIDTCGTPEKRCDMLVAELTGAFSPGEESMVMQALEKITAEAEGHAAWSSLVQSRDAAWEADSLATFGSMSKSTRREAEKAGKKARQLQGDAQAFFTAIEVYFYSLSNELRRASVNVSQSPSSFTLPTVVDEDEQATPLSRSDRLLDKLETGLVENKLKAEIAIAMGKTLMHRLNRVRVHGHPSGTLSKTSAQVTDDSVIRSVLWQWQQPAIKIQYASGALLSKVDELQEIKGMFSSGTVAQDEGRKPEDSNTPVSAPVADDRVAQVRQWVNERAEQAKERAKPETLQAEKLAVLEKLLDGDIDNARALTGRLKKEAENTEDLLRKLRAPVLGMVIQRTELPPVLKTVDALLSKMARDLTTAMAALDKACQAATTRDFAGAKKQASTAQLLATKMKEKLSTESARLTERPLDEHSRGSRLARHWANIAREHHLNLSSSPDAAQVLSFLKKRGGLEEVLSVGDPEGYLFATRLAGELDNARHDELRLPMSPEHYAALEKGIVEYIVKWGQRRVSRAGTRLIIELAFEHGLDTVSFSLSNLFRLPYKVIKASIKVPYSVNKINHYIMPGNDKPYKAINNLLGKKLKQLGFNLITAPLPGVVKLAAGAAVTAGAAAYNVYVDRKENTFSAIYGRVAEGEKSQKIKMDSLNSMVFDSGVDGTTTAAFKGARRAWKPGKDALGSVPGKPFVNAYSDDLREGVLWLAQGDEIITPLGTRLTLKGKQSFRIAVREHVEELQKHPSGRALLEGLAGKDIEICPPYADDWLRKENNGRHYYGSRIVGNTIFFDPYNTYYGASRDIDTEEWRDLDPSIVLFHELLHISVGDSRHDTIVPSDPKRLDENDYRREFYESRNQSVVERYLLEDERDDNQYASASNQGNRLRHKRAVEEKTTDQSNQKVPTGGTPPPYYDGSKPYHELSEEKRKLTYSYAIIDILDKITKDGNLPQYIRNNAHDARIGIKKLVLVQMKEFRLNNTVFLPDSNGSDSGVLIRLNAKVPYSYISGGKDLPDDLKNDMPHDSHLRRFSWSIPAFGTPRKVSRPSGFEIFDKIKNEREGYRFNSQNSMSISDLSAKLADNIEADYKLKGFAPENKLLISRAINGAQLPVPDITSSEVTLRVEFTWGGATAEDYLRAFEKPFATFAGQVQLMLSASERDTIQEAEKKVSEAEHIGSWIDTTAGVVASVTPGGIVFSSLQSAAGIIADLAEGKDPDPLAVAGLVVGSIPVGRLSAKIAKVSRIGAKGFTYTLMVGNKAVDLGIVGRSIKTAVETGEPLAIYQALLTSGMSVKNSFDMTKNMSVHFKLSNKIEDSASLEQLEEIQNNASVSPEMPERTFKLGKTQLHGKINKGEIEISRDGGATWERGSELHLLAYRLQNAGGGRGLPEEGESTPQTRLQPTESPENAQKEEVSTSQERLQTVERPAKAQKEEASTSQEFFEDRTRFNLKVNKPMRKELKRISENIRIKSFNPRSSKYEKNDNFTLTRFVLGKKELKQEISYPVLIRSLDDMRIKAVELMSMLENYNGADKTAILHDLERMRLTMGNTKDNITQANTPERNFYFLTGTQSGPEDISNHYGLIEFEYKADTNELIQRNIVFHPYTLISKYPALMDYLKDNKNLSDPDLEKYNIKNLEKYLNINGVKKEITYYKSLTLTKVNTISFDSDNPIGKKIGRKLLSSIPKLPGEGDKQLIEPTIESRPDRALSMTENTLIQETTTYLNKSLGSQYITFTMNPRENCANAAIEVSKTLKHNSFTDVKIFELGIWPNGGTETQPSNHYVVMATKGDINIVVDLTAGQFDRYGFKGPIISTKDNWIYQWQQNLSDKPRTLIKMVRHRGGFGTSAFTSRYLNPQVVVPEGVLLKRSSWYKSEVEQPVTRTEVSIKRTDLSSGEPQLSLPELYNKTKKYNKHRKHTLLDSEVKTNTAVVTREINKLYHGYVTKNPIPLNSTGNPKFTVSIISFGSMARNELLLTSDIDLQTIVVTSDAYAAEARTYTKAMMDHVKSEWAKVRNSVNSHPDATALEIDSVMGVEGIIVVDSVDKVVELMKAKKMGPNGYSDIYADSHAIYESKPGTYQKMFEEYEAKLQNTEINGLFNEAVSDLGAPPATLKSAKQTFMRPITLAVGSLYRKLRAKLVTRLPYKTNTFERAEILKEHGIIDEATYKNIRKVLLRAFKWEQEAGLKDFKHGQQVLPNRATPSSTQEMYNFIRQIQQELLAANKKIDKFLEPQSNSQNTVHG